MWLQVFYVLNIFLSGLFFCFSLAGQLHRRVSARRAARERISKVEQHLCLTTSHSLHISPEYVCGHALLFMCGISTVHCLILYVSVVSSNSSHKIKSLVSFIYPYLYRPVVKNTSRPFNNNSALFHTADQGCQDPKIIQGYGYRNVFDRVFLNSRHCLQPTVAYHTMLYVLIIWDLCFQSNKTFYSKSLTFVGIAT